MVAAYKGSISSIVSSWGVKEPRKGIDERKKKKIREDPSSLYVYTHRLYDEGEEKDIFPLKKKNKLK